MTTDDVLKRLIAKQRLGKVPLSISISTSEYYNFLSCVSHLNGYQDTSGRRLWMGLKVKAYCPKRVAEKFRINCKRARRGYNMINYAALEKIDFR